MDNKENVSWALEIGFYPGIVVGLRTYDEPEQESWVLYIPFVDLCLTIYK